jgi:hypothetical protein
MKNVFIGIIAVFSIVNFVLLVGMDNFYAERTSQHNIVLRAIVQDINEDYTCDTRTLVIEKLDPEEIREY